MPTLTPSTPSSAFTLQKIVNSARAYPELVPVLGTGGYAQEPALTIANDVLMRILAQGMDWKWNRAYVPPILTVALQQDYVTQVLDVGWLETGWCVDINNNTNNGNRAAKPVPNMEAVRDLPQTSDQAAPFQLSYIQNRLAFMGQWSPQTAYGCGYGQPQTPVTPIQQFVDANGNILYVNSVPLKLSINSPGFSGTPIALPATAPYGTSGTVEPVLEPDAPAGKTIQDGTVIWTVADPEGYAIRLGSLPPLSGLAWLVCPVYQMKPRTFVSLQDTIQPIPNEFAYLFRQGFMAFCYEAAGSKLAANSYAKWEEALQTALRSADRQQESSTFYPSSSIMGGGAYGGAGYGIDVGPAWPWGSY